MANQLEDFLITLGFDTSKITKQIKDVQAKLEGIAADIDANRVKNGRAAETQITQNLVQEEKKRNRTKKKSAHDAHVHTQKLHKERISQEVKDFQLVEKVLAQNHQKAIKREAELQALAAKRSRSSSMIESARRQQAVRALLYPEANPQLVAMGNFYRKEQSNQSAIGNKNEALRRRSAVGTVRNLQAFQDLAADFGPSGRSAAAGYLRQARDAASKGNVEKIKRIRSEIQKMVRDLKDVNKQKAIQVSHDAHILAFQKQQAKIQQKAVGPDQGRVADYITGLQASGRIPASLARQIQQGAMQQSTQKGAEQFINQAARAGRYQQMGVRGSADIGSVIAGGNRQALSDLNNQLGAAAAKMAAIERRSIGAAAAMGGMHDSTRNMVRELASVYTMLAATGYIKEQAKAMDGMQAGLVAVTNDAKEADVALTYLKDTILQNGLSVKEAGKDFVKLKAAMGKNAPLQDTIDAYEALARTGVVFQISQDDMTGTIRALGQIKQLKVCHHSNVV